MLTITSEVYATFKIMKAIITVKSPVRISANCRKINGFAMISSSGRNYNVHEIDMDGESYDCDKFTYKKSGDKGYLLYDVNGQSYWSYNQSMLNSISGTWSDTQTSTQLGTQLGTQSGTQSGTRSWYENIFAFIVVCVMFVSFFGTIILSIKEAVIYINTFFNSE
jgi:hypothetical protein